MLKRALDFFELGSNRNWLRLRTILALRWWAIAGQVAALIVAQKLYNLQLANGLCYMAVGATVLTNLTAALVYPENKRLSETETLAVVLFDMLQLGLLLYLTGGLNNPFSILIVGPVIVSASAVSARASLFLGICAIVIVSVLMFYFMPLRTEQGFILRMPDLFRLGNWFAIVIAILFLGVYARWVVSEMRAMQDALQATQLALSREQKLTDLGGVVAAAAHELGTPLATIKLTSSELADELSDHEDLYCDAMLIRDQADRCRDILRSMGRAGKDDLHLRQAPISAVVDEAAQPHQDRGKTILVEHGAGFGKHSDHPVIMRHPEVIHGLRNLVQNAVDFANSTVWIETIWTNQQISVRIMDDGPGYPPHFIGRIGDPLLRRRSSPHNPRRPEYEGMGLGLFIAKTLLERSGADLTFANGRDDERISVEEPSRQGAFVEVVWPRQRLEVENGAGRSALGENAPITN